MRFTVLLLLFSGIPANPSPTPTPLLTTLTCDQRLARIRGRSITLISGLSLGKYGWIADYDGCQIFLRSAPGGPSLDALGPIPVVRISGIIGYEPGIPNGTRPVTAGIAPHYFLSVTTLQVRDRTPPPSPLLAPP